MNISFTKQQEEYIARLLASGDYKNASEVVRDAMRLHKVYTSKVLEDLREEISKGWDGDAHGVTATHIAQQRSKKTA